MIIRDTPYPIIKLKNKVYKFLSQEEIKNEISWQDIKKYLNYFNKSSFNNFKIPDISLTKYFIQSEYLGKSIFFKIDKIYDLFQLVKKFSNFYKDKNKNTISLGDIQLRNVYTKKNDFILLDLGKGAGEQVYYLYNEARLILNIADCGFYNEAINIFSKEDNKDILIIEIYKRSIFVFKKRLKKRKFKSALFRLILFLVFYFRLKNNV